MAAVTKHVGDWSEIVSELGWVGRDPEHPASAEDVAESDRLTQQIETFVDWEDPDAEYVAVELTEADVRSLERLTGGRL